MRYITARGTEQSKSYLLTGRTKALDMAVSIHQVAWTSCSCASKGATTKWRSGLFFGVINLRLDLRDKVVCFGSRRRTGRAHEGHCFVSLSPKCFHSLNKFNKTPCDWQEGALPQCLLFALAFLVGSCASFWTRRRLKICTARARAHTHALYRWGTSCTFIQASAGVNVLLRTRLTRVIWCH